MKKTSDDLYCLIQSLDKTEKGYFRKFVYKNESGNQKNYIKLFDAIDAQVNRQKPYDERLITEKYKDEKFIQQLSFTKSYLYNIILKSLSSYDSGKTIGSHINTLIDNILVLFSRGLYAQSLKIARQAKKFAYKNEQFVKLYDILRFERNILIRLAPANSIKLTGQIYSEQLSVLELLRNYTEYAILYSDAFDSLDEYGLFKGDVEEKKFELIMKHSLMASDKCALSFRSKLYYYGITYAYSIAKIDFENAYFYVKKQIEIQNSNTEFRKNYPFSYWAEYINLLEPAIYLKKHAEVGTVLALMDKTVADKTNGLSRANRKFLWEALINSKLIYYVRNFKTDKVDSLIEELSAGGKPNSGAGSSRLNSAFFYIALYYFINMEFELSLEWINKTVVDFGNDYNLNYYSSVPILKILIHYELGNYDVVDSLMLSLSRYMKKNKFHHEMETEFLKTLKKLINRPGAAESENILRDFKKNITGFSKDTVFYNLDLISWAESKIKKTSFGEIILTKLKNSPVKRR